MQYLRDNEISIQQSESLRTWFHLVPLKERMGKDGQLTAPIPTRYQQQAVKQQLQNDALSMAYMPTDLGNGEMDQEMAPQKNLWITFLNFLQKLHYLVTHSSEMFVLEISVCMSICCTVLLARHPQQWLNSSPEQYQEMQQER